MTRKPHHQKDYDKGNFRIAKCCGMALNIHHSWQMRFELRHCQYDFERFQYL